MFDAIFRTKVQDLWALYTSTGDLRHHGEQGLFRELFLRGLLESLLPVQFGVGSGVIIDNWGRQSPQADLIVFDRRLMLFIIDSWCNVIYTIDSVLRVVEVKSTLRRRDLTQFGQMVNALDPLNADGLKLTERGTLADGHAFYPFASLFAYRSLIVNVDAAIQSIENLHGKVAPVYVVSRAADGHENEVDISKVRQFCNTLLDQLEATSASRGRFALSQWMR